MSGASIPFCRHTMAVSRPIIGPMRLRGGLHVVELRRQEHDVDGADRGRIVGGGGGRDQQVPERAPDREPVRADRRQVRAARDEGHLGAGRRQPRAEVAADGAGPHDRDLHR